MYNRLLKYIMALLAILPVTNTFAQSTTQNSLLWEVTGNGLKKPSYVYGTIHIPDKRVFAFNDSVFPKLRECDAFASEIAFTQANMARMASAAMLTNGKKLKDFFTKKEYESLKTIMTKNGIDIDLLQQFKPFVVISLLSKAQTNNDMPYVLDEYLSNKAKDAGKTLLGIEDVDEQMTLLDKLPIKELLETIYDTNELALKNEMEALVDAYTKPDLEKLQDMMLKFELEEKVMGKKIMTDRNHIMSDRINNLIQAQSIFIAIGAGHLPGKEGVLELLRKKGFTVKPIIAGHTIDVTQDDELPPPQPSPVDSNTQYSIPRYFVVDNGDFTVKFPGVPDTSSQSLKTDAGQVTINFYTLETKGNNVVLMVAFTDYAKDKEPKTDDEISAFLDAAANGSVSKMAGAVVKSKTRIQMDGIPGIDVVIDYMHGAAVIHMMNYLLHNRVYTVQVINSANEDNNKEMKDFFASFKIKKK